MNESQERNELVDHALDKLHKLGQKWNNRLELNNLRLTERYLIGEIEILVHIRWWSARPGYSHDFCAVLKGNGDHTCGMNDGRVMSFRNESVNFSPDSRGHRIQNRMIGEAKTEPLNSIGDDEQDTVFVGIVQLADDPKRSIPSLVRLDSLHTTYCLRSDSLYLSLGSIFKFGSSFIRGVEKREGNPCNRLIAVGLNQSASEMVERASQAINCVSDNQGELQGQWLLKAKDAVAGLRVLLTPDQIWAAFSKGSDPAFQITNVVFGPFDFRPDADKPV